MHRPNADINHSPLDCRKAGLPLWVVGRPLSRLRRAGAIPLRFMDGGQRAAAELIHAIHQARDGYLWLATSDGLVRFDGVRFTVFNKSNSTGIGSNRLTCLYEDRQGDLWIGTENGGVTRRRGGVFTTYTTDHGLPHNAILGVTGAEAGNLWVLSGNLLTQWQEATGRFMPVDPNQLKFGFGS